MASKGTIIITGASQGIGAGAVQAFLDRGYNVVANSRNITRSDTFRESDKLALVAGNIGEIAVAAKVVEAAITRVGLTRQGRRYYDTEVRWLTLSDCKLIAELRRNGVDDDAKREPK